VDDRGVMVSGASRDIVVGKMQELFVECDRVARMRNMKFAARKTDWMGMG